MNIPWTETKCILCLTEGKLSKEHVIPKSLGGRLTCRFLCKSCNSVLGHELQGRIMADPDVLRFAAGLRHRVPKLGELVDGHPHIGMSSQGPVYGYIKKDEFQVSTKTLDDESLIIPSSHTARALKTKLQRSGSSDEEIEAGLAKLDCLPVREDNEIEISKGYAVANWLVWDIKPDMSKTQTMSHLVAATIAYEFFALLAGNAIYGEADALAELRSALLNRNLHSTVLSVERLYAEIVEPLPIHGIAFEGNDPYTKIQIRLLGKLAFRVHFHHLSIDSPRVHYTHDLENGEEDWIKTD